MRRFICDLFNFGSRKICWNVRKLYAMNGIKTNLESGGNTSLTKPLSKRFVTGGLVANVRIAYFQIKVDCNGIILKIMINRIKTVNLELKTKCSIHFRLRYHKCCQILKRFVFASFRISIHNLKSLEFMKFIAYFWKWNMNKFNNHPIFRNNYKNFTNLDFLCNKSKKIPDKQRFYEWFVFTVGFAICFYSSLKCDIS